MYNQANLKLKPSRLLAGALALPYLCAVFLTLSHDTSSVLKLLLTAVLLLTARQHIRLLALLKSPRSVRQLTLSQERIFVTLNSSGPEQAHLIAKPFVSKYLCLLVIERHVPLVNNTRTARLNRYFNRHVLVISRYNSDSIRAFRQFRVLLKYGRHHKNDRLDTLTT